MFSNTLDCSWATAVCSAVDGFLIKSLKVSNGFSACICLLTEVTVVKNNWFVIKSSKVPNGFSTCICVLTEVTICKELYVYIAWLFNYTQYISIEHANSLLFSKWALHFYLQEHACSSETMTTDSPFISTTSYTESSQPVSVDSSLAVSRYINIQKYTLSSESLVTSTLNVCLYLRSLELFVQFWADNSSSSCKICIQCSPLNSNSWGPTKFVLFKKFSNYKLALNIKSKYNGLSRDHIHLSKLTGFLN